MDFGPLSHKKRTRPQVDGLNFIISTTPHKRTCKSLKFTASYCCKFAATIEKDPLVNTFISVPKDKGSLNCAAFVAGIIEAVLDGANFPAKVSAHWHKGTTFMVKFEESVIARDKLPGD